MIIRTLGGFGVTIAGEPVPSSAWQSWVAREVVGMLAANRGRSVHREVVIERLWPDEDATKAGNRLSVASEHDPRCPRPGAASRQRSLSDSGP